MTPPANKLIGFLHAQLYFIYSLLRLASEIISRRDPKLVTIFGVILNQSLNRGRVLTIALECAVHCFDGGSKPSVRDRVDKVHPVPQSCLEGNQRIGGHGLGGVEPVEMLSLIGP